MADLNRRFRDRNRFSTKPFLTADLQERFAYLCAELHHASCAQQHGSLGYDAVPEVFLKEIMKLLKENLGDAVAGALYPTVEGYMTIAETHEHDLVGLGAKWLCCWRCTGRTGESSPYDAEFYRLARQDPEYHLTGLAAELHELV